MLGIAYFESPVGCIRIKTNNDVVTEIEFVDAAGDDTELSAPVLHALRELEEYFAGVRTTFSLKLAAKGTLFQETVWQLLQQIPFGTTTPYNALAKKLGNPQAIRAVGGANHVNPIPIVIPCHRVVGADRSLVGYGGGLWRKRWLLEHERQVKEGTRTVPLTEFFSS